MNALTKPRTGSGAVSGARVAETEEKKNALGSYVPVNDGKLGGHPPKKGKSDAN